MVSNPTERSSEVTSDWVCSLEGKKRGRGQSEGGSSEEKGCRGEEEKEEDIGVSLTTPERSTRGRSHSFRGYWRVSDCRT